MLLSMSRRNKWPDNTVHFLHVGKAAGSQIKSVARELNASSSARKLQLHRHKVLLKHLPKTQDYFFSVRDPADRFKSGFYSRLRQGRPRYNVLWSPHEEVAFENFQHANDLAEALFADGELGRKAAAAMRSIRHPASNLVDWFGAEGHMFDLRPPVWIIRQERFHEDLSTFMGLIGADLPASFGDGASRTHANDYSGIPTLSEKARKNLRRWYTQDYEFLRLCEHWLEENSP